MSDEVSNFLRSVEQLKDRRLEEDEARSRELEEKILQEKRERQARRAERARSISPQKSSPANTPPPPSHRRDGLPAPDAPSLIASPPLDGPASPLAFEPRRQPDGMGSLDYSTSPTKENDAPFAVDAKQSTMASPPGAGLARTPTLLWQRRPPSQASDRPRSRPLSVVAAENAAARSSAIAAEQAEPAASRDQIAQALASKDASWFRQTADRGQNSAAYRRTQVEDEDRLDMSTARTQLPGMAGDAQRDGAPQDSSPAGPRLGSPLPLTPVQRLDPPAGDADAASRDRSNVVSPPSGRVSPTRPISPTKGMGGFVQSAMMKRTDSVKRWSVSSQPSLQRADPVVSSRASLESANRTAAPQPGGSRPNSRGKESSSRPTSSNGNEATPLTVDISQAQSSEQRGHEENEKTSPPTSPSKTMDPRRWSPTKSSSWLEAALNKPESPKPKPAPPQSSQPAWMVELNKAKAQKAGTPSSDLERSSSVARKHEVKTGGLMRSSPMGGGIKPPGLGGVGAHHSPSTSISGDKGASSSFRSNLSRSTSNDDPDASSGKPPPTAAGSPPTTRTKPETPPKKDFRNNLKARQLPPGDAKSDGNEFKNVFGALRPTKTQNFVAQDVFKDNIMRGKAALNLTGGPKPREKKDELKEAILQKKAEFKQAKQEGRGVATNAHGPVEKPLPEGLAKKMEMARQGGALSRRASAASETTSDTPSGTFASNRTSAVSTFSKRDSADTIATPLEKDAPWPALNKDKSPPPGRFPKPGGGALADRFNPALAGFLARGPPSMAAGPGKDSSDKPGSEEPSAPGPQLSHMTKNRARGPKRKAPSSAVTASDSSRIGTIALVDSSRKTAPEAVLSPGAMISLVDSSKRSPADGPVIPLVDSSRMDMRPRSPTKIHEQVAAVAARAQQPSARAVDERPEESTSQPPSPRKLDMTKLSRFLDESALADEMPRPLSPSKTGGRPLPEPRPLSPQKTGGRPLPASPRKDVFSDSVDPGPVMSARNGAALFGGAAATAAAAAAAAKPTRVSATPVLQPQRGRSRSPTKSSGPVPPIEIGFGPTSPPLSSPMRSPTRYAVEVSAMFKDFFGNERPHREYHADTADILMKRPVPEPKINTQKVQLFRLSGDGKKQAVPAHHERVLFEREMYLCPHVFTNESGKKVSEVYFWAGDEVPEATIEDAQIFANREARAQGGKLVRLQQGKETGEFIQALGGILIIRRGSSNKYDSLAANMLCGRQYLGQITFDEVDFAPNSLCSGFPYLITQQGKCYLWKGKGSDVDELSCARLIGMDLALMGELAEVDDGDEPAEFWDIFDGGGSKAGSADHWRLKPNYGKYCARLFCSDAASRQQIVEIHPFCQADLSPSNIYILDAFFEMYIVVGYGAQSQYAAFHNALDFAQEYAILASGMEDRPYVPISTVVLEGIPRDLKSVFRKWRDGASPTRMNANNPVSPSLKRGRSLRIVPLNQALQALAE